MVDSPPPLKTLVAKVAQELQQSRGDPASIRKLELALATEKQKSGDLERVLRDNEKEHETQIRLLELRISELERRYFDTQEENAKLKAAANPEDASQFDEIFRLISRQRKSLERDRDLLNSERETFETEKMKFENLRTDKMKQAFAFATSEAAHSSIIAHRVHEFTRKLENSSREEIREIRESLEQVLASKLGEIQN